MAEASVAIRFSRGEIALLLSALDAKPLPENPDDQRLVLELRSLFEDLLRDTKS